MAGFCRFRKACAVAPVSMKQSAPRRAWEETWDTQVEDDAQAFKPLTPEEAEAWRKRHPVSSVWRVVAGQALAGLVVVVLAGLLTGQAAVAWSAGYGALAVVLPAALFARGVASRRAEVAASAALARFFVWELAKLGLTLAMLAVAPRLVQDLSWLALLVGMVVTMKMYWVALRVRPGVR